MDVAAAAANPDPAPVTQTAQLSADTLLGRLTGVQAAAAEPASQTAEDASSAPSDAAAASSSPASSAASSSSATAAGTPEAPGQDAGQTGGQPGGQAPAAPPAADSAGGQEPTLTVRNQHDGNRLVTAPASEIIAGIVEAEMGASYETEALKAQSVAAYSWLLCNCLLYTSRCV